MSTGNKIEAVPAEEATLQDTLARIVEKHPMTGRHSYFQLKYFIVNKEPTIQSKLWQCLRELKSRKETLDGIELEESSIRDQIELAEITTKKEKQSVAALGTNLPTDELSVRERVLTERQGLRRVEAMKRSLAELERRRRETEEEAAFFLQAFSDLEKIAPMKDYDDAEAQKEYWSARFSNEMNMKLMLEHRIDPELAKAVLSLPDDATVKCELVGLLSRQQAAIEAVRNKKLTAQGENG